MSTGRVYDAWGGEIVDNTRDHSTPGPSSSLYQHQPHPHTPRNPNERQAAERTSFNDRLSVKITQATGTMWCAYVFTGIGVGGLVGALTGNVWLALVFGAVSSYFLQLVMLPVIQNGSTVLSRHQEIQAEEMYHGIMRLLHENAEQAKHLGAQDTELLKQTGYLVQLVGGKPEPVVADGAVTPAASPMYKPATPVVRKRAVKKIR